MLGVEIAPQWVQNINTFVIAVGGPLMAALFTRLRARGWSIDVPKQFAASLMLMGLGFLAAAAGIALADPARAARRSSGSSSATCCKASASC